MQRLLLLQDARLGSLGPRLGSGGVLNVWQLSKVPLSCPLLLLPRNGLPLCLLSLKLMLMLRLWLMLTLMLRQLRMLLFRLMLRL